VWILWVLQFVVVHLQVLLCLHFLYKIHTLVLLVHLQMLQVRKWTNNFTETWENESMNGELTLILTWIVLTLFEFLGSLVNSTLIQCGQIPSLPSVSAYLNMNQSASINTSFAITFNGKMVASIDNFLVYGNDNTSLYRYSHCEHFPICCVHLSEREKQEMECVWVCVCVCWEVFLIFDYWMIFWIRL
jgi:hypothetical protein